MYRIVDHCLQPAQLIPSPNFNARPSGVTLDLIVIHSISLPPGQYGGCDIEALFTNCLDPNKHEYFQDIHQLEVSSHLLIKRDGTICQFVPFNQRAWHAGVSCYEERSNCNDYSVGIELEGTDQDPFEGVQYQVLADVITALLNAYPSLSTEHIVGHSDIAPGRKTDPGVGFDWPHFRALLPNAIVKHIS